NVVVGFVVVGFVVVGFVVVVVSVRFAVAAVVAADDVAVSVDFDAVVRIGGMAEPAFVVAVPGRGLDSIAVVVVADVDLVDVGILFVVAVVFVGLVVCLWLLDCLADLVVVLF
ncbi:unnamed protein product, partial [Rotaria sordida]